MFFENLCKSCGVCVYLCPEKAIIEKLKNIGVIDTTETVNNIRIKSGEVNIGEEHSVKIIRTLRSERSDKNIQIIDCPPGAGQSFFQSVDNTDFCILVTEPTILGLNDLKLAIKALLKLNLPFGIIVNKIAKENKLITEFAAENNYDILLSIPYDKKYSDITDGKISLGLDTSFFKGMRNLYKKIIEKIK